MPEWVFSCSRRSLSYRKVLGQRLQRWRLTGGSADDEEVEAEAPSCAVWLGATSSPPLLEASRFAFAALEALFPSSWNLLMWMVRFFLIRNFCRK